MTRKKSFTVFIVLLFCVCSILIGCKETLEENKLQYEINSDSITCTITGIGSYNEGLVVIPDSIDGYTVTAISKNAFSHNESIEEVFISDTVIQIGANAFSECINLSYVKLPANLTKLENEVFQECVNLQYISLPEGLEIIGEHAFQGCESLREIIIPDTVIAIKIMAFAGCSSLQEILLPEKVKEIGDSAFSLCHSLTEVFVPSSVELIDINPFNGCMSLLRIDVDENNAKYSSIDGVFYNKAHTRLIGYPAGRTNETFTIPNSVSEIYGMAFFGNEYVKELRFPDSIEIIYPFFAVYCDNCTSIYYDGTISQWLKIYRYPQWGDYLGDFIIYCTDGQITKDGTVTYK